LTASDPDAGATFTFSLACAVPGADDGSFNILGANLRTSAVFDFEAKPIYNLCVRVADQGGLTLDKNFAVTLNNLNESANTPGKVSGGGTLGGKRGAKSTFGFAISYRAGDSTPMGNVTYVDHDTRLSLLATSFDHLVIEGSHARFTGTATLTFTYYKNSPLNRMKSRARFTSTAMAARVQSVQFEIEVDDLGEPGKGDTFTIRVLAPNGYNAGGALTGGNITIH
jgi:hypothetical protein